MSASVLIVLLSYSNMDTVTTVCSMLTCMFGDFYLRQPSSLAKKKSGWDLAARFQKRACRTHVFRSSHPDED